MRMDSLPHRKVAQRWCEVKSHGSKAIWEETVLMMVKSGDIRGRNFRCQLTKCSGRRNWELGSRSRAFGAWPANFAREGPGRLGGNRDQAAGSRSRELGVGGGGRGTYQRGRRTAQRDFFYSPPSVVSAVHLLNYNPPVKAEVEPSPPSLHSSFPVRYGFSTIP